MTRRTSDLFCTRNYVFDDWIFCCTIITLI